MSALEEHEGIAPSAEELYEDAPCGYLSLLMDGTIAKANRTLLRSTGHTSEALVGQRLEQLLAPASRLYYATRWRLKLELNGEVREVPAELLRADGTRLSVLINATVARSRSGDPVAIRASVFDATDRTRYERELVSARDVERAARRQAEQLQRISVALSLAVSSEEVADAILCELVEHLHAECGEIRISNALIARQNGKRRASSDTGEPNVSLDLALGGQSIGTLAFRIADPRLMAGTDDGFLAACAAQCAQALARAQFLEETRRRSEQQATLASFGVRALEDIAMPALLAEATRTVHTSLRADLVTITQPRAGDAVSSGWLRCDTRSPTLTAAIGDGAARFGELRVHLGEDRRPSDADAEFIVGFAHVLWNAVERRRHEEVVTHQATHDSLTALPNRLLLSEHVKHEIARCRRSHGWFVVCMLDLDDFKLVNDTRGHHAGDQVLQAVSERLRKTMREGDIVARLGGDEFVILAADLQHVDDGSTLAERVTTALREPLFGQDSDDSVRASIGVVFGNGASTVEGLLRDADVAMYHAKDNGRDRYAIFDATMRDRVQSRMETEGELRGALRNGDLRVFYQPVIDTLTNRLTRFEALVRWQHPRNGLIPPDRFIPVAETSGLIVELGRWVMLTACRQLMKWRVLGIVDDEVAIAVNVSGRQLTHPRFAADVASVLSESGLGVAPGLLGLEITESVVMQSTDSPASRLDELARTGVRLLLDDFGTGASSLASLQNFPVDTLKIDRSFIGEDLDNDPIISAIVALGRALNLRIIAEGVEDAAQRASLLRLGCHELQGFLISRPLPASGIEALMVDGSLAGLNDRNPL